MSDDLNNPCVCGHDRADHWRKGERRPVSPCRLDDCDCGHFRPRRLTRQERLQGLADRGCDSWEEYRGER